MIKIHERTGYLICSTGKVFRKDGKGFLKGCVDHYGYMRHGLSLGKKYVMTVVTLHRLVAETFIPNPENKSQINHIDGNKLNNDVSNLEWCTPKENAEHKVSMNLQAKGDTSGVAKHSEAQVHEVCQMIQDGYRNNDIIKATSVTRKLVKDVRSKNTWRHISDGYEFEPIAHQGISNSTFLWVCHKLQEGLKYREILELYTGGEYLTYSCLKKIKARKMRSHLSEGFKF